MDNDTIEMDKLDAKIEVRLPTITKNFLSELSREQKVKLNYEIIKLMVEHIHMSCIDYNKYTSTKSKDTL